MSRYANSGKKFLAFITLCIMLSIVRWTLIQLAGFTRIWRSEKLSDEDLQALEAAIMPVLR